MPDIYTVVAGPTHPATVTAAALYTNGTSGDVAVRQILAIGATAGDAVSLWVVRSGKTLTDNTTQAFNNGNPIVTVAATAAVELMSLEFESGGREIILEPGDAIYALGSTGDCNLYVFAE